MARQISRAESWEQIHEAFTQVNFNAFDYSTIKESLLDYMKLYFPETFNDFIESSEFIAILEIFAYVGELISYRLDLNAHENLITTAQRKESILRLAKLISYNPSRNIPARGMVKLTSVQTSEPILDSNGKNLAGKKISWNDSNNSDWKEQFILIINQLLNQEFGTVSPDERVQVDDVLFELYTLNNRPLNSNGITTIPYQASTSSSTFPMELVPVTLTQNGPEERRPENDASFSLLYADDGLGDGSGTTGFLMFTKQGTLLKSELFFDGKTPNMTKDIATDNINETDVWVNGVHPQTRELVTTSDQTSLSHRPSNSKLGEWVSVDASRAQNILFNTSTARRKYEIETLDNDNIRLIFGDGEFSDIPAGSFDVWYRVSSNSDDSIPKQSITSETSSITYVDVSGSVQTLTFTFSLIQSLQNGSKTESIEHIRRVAPSVYYTQDRMVNGRDYNTYLLQDPTILKLRALNRTFAGESRTMHWSDASDTYSNIKIFGDDLAVYWDEKPPTDGNLLAVLDNVSSHALLTNTIQPLLSSMDFYMTLGYKREELGGVANNVRRYFNVAIPYQQSASLHLANNEWDSIIIALDLSSTVTPVVDLYYSVQYDEWTVNAHPCDQETCTSPCNSPIVDAGCTQGAAESIWMVRIQPKFSGSQRVGWDVRYRSNGIIANSQTTKFWNSNLGVSIMDYTSAISSKDTISVLGANIHANNTGILDGPKHYNIVAHSIIDRNLPDSGLPNVNELILLPEDADKDGAPDILYQKDLFNRVVDIDLNTSLSVGIITLPNDLTYIRSQGDSDMIVTVNGLRYSFGIGVMVVPFSQGTNSIVNAIQFTDVTGHHPIPQFGDDVKITFIDWVYLSRPTTSNVFKPTSLDNNIKSSFAAEQTTEPNERLVIRKRGRFPLNFAWMHYTPSHYLVDPSPSNIIDMFIITKSYYTAMKLWVSGNSGIQPQLPKPLDLRSSYGSLLTNKMISDSVIPQPGKFKILFGRKAIPELQCIFKVVRPKTSTITDNEVKTKIVALIVSFFDLDYWEFGETFFFTELAAAIHLYLGSEIDSVVMVPKHASHRFGDLFQVHSLEHELFIPSVDISDINIIQSLSPESIRQLG